ncbi:superoxide dismutase [Anaerosporobacter faecicola]|uniref:superoxide dismutase n=1 Tax=Anaerosporobacter faecicola TaxID=2718714 RepID=UPI00143BF225|nr:Fe-Mn family superoxide dismutase [Anaerosporobacter faecicola]
MLEKIDFQYDEDITVINQIQFDEHIQLYEAYIRKYNEIMGIMKAGNSRPEEANATYSKFRCLKNGQSFALNAVILHELYFSNIGGGQYANSIQSSVEDLISRDFGSFDNWKLDFIATAKASRGWAILAYEQRTKCLQNILLDAHDKGQIVYSYPLIVLDVYEHAYFIQYGIQKENYINNFLYNINWPIVKKRADALLASCSHNSEDNQ